MSRIKICRTGLSPVKSGFFLLVPLIHDSPDSSVDLKIEDDQTHQGQSTSEKKTSAVDVESV